ncbi:MAG TPA: hypothetical protein VE078_08160 [Thermoanaerobaculia bacterium]|nr:hypothetical protein [Thermoanaerobaculia bacterium]
MKHPISRDSLELFAAGAATREESRRITIHLLKGCPTCAGALRDLDRCRVPMEAYDRTLDRFERELRSEVQAPSGMLTVVRAVLNKVEQRLEDALVRH